VRCDERRSSRARIASLPEHPRAEQAVDRSNRNTLHRRREQRHRAALRAVGDESREASVRNPFDSTETAMNKNLGLIGRKLGCTQLFSDDGTVVRVTVVQAGPCTVVRKRTEEKDGYSALQIAFGERSAKHCSKPLRGYFAKNGIEPKKVSKKGREVEMLPAVLREIRLPPEEVAKYEVGQVLTVEDVFKVGQFVDASGVSRGRGFSGVFRRHNFAGFVSTHGTHEYKRHGGSIGTNMTPGRTLPGLRMPGQYGNKKSTQLNLKIADVVADKNLVLIEGSVPGARNQIVMIRGAVKNGMRA
jgi:large subunit ribosomal protein L3